MMISVRRFVVVTGPRDGGKFQLVKCLNILQEQIIDLQDLKQRYQYSPAFLETVLFNKLLGIKKIIGTTFGILLLRFPERQNNLGGL